VKLAQCDETESTEL